MARALPENSRLSTSVSTETDSTKDKSFAAGPRILFRKTAFNRVAARGGGDTLPTPREYRKALLYRPHRAAPSQLHPAHKARLQRATSQPLEQETPEDIDTKRPFLQMCAGAITEHAAARHKGINIHSWRVRLSDSPKECRRTRVEDQPSGYSSREGGLHRKSIRFVLH